MYGEAGFSSAQEIVLSPVSTTPPRIRVRNSRRRMSSLNGRGYRASTAFGKAKKERAHFAGEVKKAAQEGTGMINLCACAVVDGTFCICLFNRWQSRMKISLQESCCRWSTMNCAG